MKCQQVEILISAYLDGEVTSSEWQQAENHIALCSICEEILKNFQFSTTIFQQKMQRAEPALNLWPELASRIESSHQPSASVRLSQWFRKVSEIFILKPPAYIRAAQVGFAIIVLVIIFSNRIQYQIEPQNIDIGQSLAERSQSFSVLQETMDSAQNREQLTRAALVQQIINYFDQTGVLLMEIKNSEPEQEQLDLSTIRNASQNLLEKTVLIKQDLQKTDLNDLKGTVDNLELILFDLANLKDTLENSDIEMLKATILKQDILIKIEIFDVKSLEIKEPKPYKNKNESQQKDRRSI